MAINIRAGKTEKNGEMVAGKAGMAAGRAGMAAGKTGIMTIFP